MLQFMSLGIMVASANQNYIPINKSGGSLAQSLGRQTLKFLSFILWRDNLPQFPHSTQVPMGTSFTGKVSKDRLTSCPRVGESHLSADLIMASRGQTMS